MKHITSPFLFLLAFALAFHALAFGPPHPTNYGIPDMTILKGSTVIIDYSAHWEDDDLSGGRFLGATFPVANTNFTPSAEGRNLFVAGKATWTGTQNVIVLFTDNEAFTNSDTFAVTSSATASAVTVPMRNATLSDTTIAAGTTLTRNLSTIFSHNTQTLTYTVSGGSGLTGSVDASKILSLTSTSAGTTNVIVTAFDTLKFGAADTFQLILGSLGIAPSIHATKQRTGVFCQLLPGVGYRFSAQNQSAASIGIHDVFGRLVGSLHLKPSSHIIWEPPATSAVYFISTGTRQSRATSKVHWIRR